MVMGGGREGMNGSFTKDSRSYVSGSNIMDKLSSRRGLLLFAHNNSKSTSDTSSAEERDTTAAIEYGSVGRRVVSRAPTVRRWLDNSLVFLSVRGPCRECGVDWNRRGHRSERESWTGTSCAFVTLFIGCRHQWDVALEKRLFGAV
eukprot:scaffold154_cov185-Alexandrium_tamarense.AAC.8